MPSAVLKGMAGYAGLLLAPAEGFCLWPRLFFPFGQNKGLLCCFGPVLVFSSNLSNWECHLSIVPKMGTMNIPVQSTQNQKISKKSKKSLFPIFLNCKKKYIISFEEISL